MTALVRLNNFIFEQMVWFYKYEGERNRFFKSFIVRGLAFGFFSLGLGNLSAQSRLLVDKFRLSTQRGIVFPTNKFLKGNNAQKEPISEFGTLSLSIGKQTNGRQYWQENYKYPYLGAGVYVASFGENKQELGTPVAIYGFLSAPFASGKQWSFNYDLQLGFAMNWKPFSPISNPNNISIGTKQSVYIDLGLHLDYLLSKELSVELGGSLSHFSNGALKKPNYGINTFAPRLSLAYQIAPQGKSSVTSPSPPVMKQYEWNIGVFGASTNVIFDSLQLDILEKYEGVNFMTLGFTSSINKMVGYKSKIGLGLAVGYHSSYGAVIAVIEDEIEKEENSLAAGIAISIFPSYELMIDRFSILLQPGLYVYRGKINDNNPRLYQRIGVKYHVSDDFFVGANLRAFDFHVSDFIEWNIGYRIDWK